MREYESVFVLNPSIEDSQVDAEVQKIREFLSSRQSEITEIQKWGRRKLAYEINKNKEGIYTLIRFNAEAEVPVELDRRYRLNENMLRFLTVVYERPPVGEGEAGERESGEGGRAPAPAAPAAAPGEAAPKAAAPAEGSGEPSGTGTTAAGGAEESAPEGETKSGEESPVQE